MAKTVLMNIKENGAAVPVFPVTDYSAITNTPVNGKVYTESSSSTTIRTVLVEGITSYTQLLNVPLFIKATTYGVNSATTLNINSLGEKNIYMPQPAGSAMTTTPQYYWVNTGQTYCVVWDGSYFRLISTNYRSATTSYPGVVQLTDSVSSTSTTTAATPNSVKTAYDLANTATQGVNEIKTNYTKKDNPKSCIKLLEGNLMKYNGAVMSLSPYDKEKASTYNATTKLNSTDPSTVPSTVLVYYKTMFVDPGWEIYDKDGNLIDVPVTVKVTDINNNIIKTVNDYKGWNALSTSDAVNTSKSFENFDEGTYKLKYITTIDGITNSENTYVRYVKLRYLRGDCNRDGKINFHADFDAFTDYYLTRKNYPNSDFIFSMADLDRQGDTIDSDDYIVYINMAGYSGTYIQDFEPFGTALNMDFGKADASHDHTSGIKGVRLGSGSTVGDNGTALSYASSTSDKNAAIAKAPYAKCERWNEECKNGDGTSNGKTYYSTVMWNGETTSTTATEIYLGNTSGQRCTVLANSAFNFHIMATGFDGTDAKTFELKGMIKRTTSTVLVGNVISTSIGTETAVANWNVTASADITNNALVIKPIGGTSSKPVKWVARGELTEIRI